MPSNGNRSTRSGDARNLNPQPGQDASGQTRFVQYDQYGNPLNDGFAYTPEMEDFVYDGKDDSGYGVPVDPDAYAATLDQADAGDSRYGGQYGGGYDPTGAGYDYQYEGGGYQYYPEPGSGGHGGGLFHRRRKPKEPSSGPAAPRRRHRHRGLIVLLVIVAAIVGLYLVVCAPIDEKLAFSSDEAEGLSQQETWHFPGEPYYVLALGSDAREGDTVSRTDTIILVRIDPIASKVTLLSIPRDTMVSLEGYGTSKINAAYAYGGAALATQTVRELTGLPVSHVAVVHFEELADLVDSLGGITVEVPVDVNDPDYTGLVMDAGTYEMDGETALLFSRVRHGFATGDFQRQADQQIVIQAIISKALSLGPTQLPAVMEELGDLLSTDMRLYEILPLMLRFQITTPTVYSCSLPGESVWSGGVSYVSVWANDDMTALTEEAQDVLKAVDAGQDPNASDSNEAAASAGSLSSAD